MQESIDGVPGVLFVAVVVFSLVILLPGQVHSLPTPAPVLILLPTNGSSGEVGLVRVKDKAVVPL